MSHTSALVAGFCETTLCGSKQFSTQKKGCVLLGRLPVCRRRKKNRNTVAHTGHETFGQTSWYNRWSAFTRNVLLSGVPLVYVIVLFFTLSLPHTHTLICNLHDTTICLLCRTAILRCRSAMPRQKHGKTFVASVEEAPSYWLWLFSPITAAAMPSMLYLSTMPANTRCQTPGTKDVSLFLESSMCYAVLGASIACTARAVSIRHQLERPLVDPSFRSSCMCMSKA